jgi:succinate dehydrogenase / fumarate reductase flavoprotein subunit
MSARSLAHAPSIADREGRNDSALRSNVPSGPLAEKWTRRRSEMRLVGPTSKRRFHVVVVGSGLAGASAAAGLSELGYRVTCLCFQDSPRRAHSVAAQGGINAAKNYQNDGDSVERLFKDTLSGGDYRAREANVYRLAELSTNIIDQAVAVGVPFAREYGGQLANRSFGGALVSRTFYARGQTGQQLLLGVYQSLSKEVAAGGVTLLPRRDLLDLVVVGGRARGVVCRDLLTGELEAHLADAVVLATGGYANAFFLSTNARGSNASAVVRAFRRGAAFANPSFVQFHPTCLPVSGEHQSKLTLMSESLRNDGRVWVPLRPGDGRLPSAIPESERDYYLERLYPRYGNLAPRDLASRAAKQVCDDGRGVGASGRGVYLDFSEAIGRIGEPALRERYGNLFEMYEGITGVDPLRDAMSIYPAAHYSMGGLWVDYDLMTTLPGLFAIGEANFSDHGANRLGASALMQALADGTFIVPSSVTGYLASTNLPSVAQSTPEVRGALDDTTARIARVLSRRGSRTALELHRELGKILWEGCGLSRSASGLTRARAAIATLRAEFGDGIAMVGANAELNQELERALRVADFFELGELFCDDALAREESCGCHFREEHQDESGEPLRDDERFAEVAVFEHNGEGRPARRSSEPLTFENVVPGRRNYR